MVLSASGNLDHDRFVALAEKLLSAMPAERAVAPAPARYAGGEYRQGRDLEQLHLVLGFPGIPLADRDYYAAWLLPPALGGGMSSRLFQEVREKRGLVYTIHSFAHSFRDGGIFGIYAGTGEGEAGELVPVLCEETMRLADGLTEIELARAKAQMKAGLLMSLESTGARCEQMAQHMLIHGTPFDPADLVRRVEAVDNAAIGPVVEDWRTDQGYNFFILRDDEALAGGIGLTNLRRGVAETGSLGYWIGEPFARQRYMTAALPLVLDFAFDRLRLHRVEAACLPSNVPTRALLLRTGFQQEGSPRDYLPIDGKRQDHLPSAVLRA